MFTFNLETMLLLAGILFGITFALISGISKEEKIKYIGISVFGSVLIAFIGISFYAYGYSLEFPLGFMVWSCIGFIPTFLIGLGYRKKKDKVGVAVIRSIYGPSHFETESIIMNAPTMDAELRTLKLPLLGVNIELKIKIKNISKEELDDLYIILKISDLCLEKKERKIRKDLPDLVQNEEREFIIKKRIGRYRKYAIDLSVVRNRISLGEFHWTSK